MECLDFCILATLFKNLETKFLPLSERGKPGNPCLLMLQVLNTLAKISTALFDMRMVSALCKMADEYKKVPIHVLNNSRFSNTDDSYNFE